jgi:hypothetical protein
MIEIIKYIQKDSHENRKISKNNFLEKITKLILIFISFVFLFLTITSASYESATMDELVHVPAGYSYIIKQDIRLNPEHPPLLKDLSGLFLLPLKPAFPDSKDSWKKDINGEWELGPQFFYQSGNDPDKILFFARLAPIFLSLFFLLLLFKITRENFGKKVAFLTLLLFSFSPTILAHSRYVTTDIAAAFSFFISIFYFLKFLKKPNKKNLIMVGLIFGISQLFKFSLLFLIPFFILIAFLWSLTFFSKNNLLFFFKKTSKYLASTFLIFFIGYLFVVWPVYKFHTLNYPSSPKTEQEKQNIIHSQDCKELEKNTYTNQYKDIFCQLKKTRFNNLALPLAQMSENSILRPFSEYIFGALLAKDRIAEGGKNYFLGEVSEKSHLTYFPTIYFIKEPLAFHILTLIAIIFFFSRYSNKNKKITLERKNLKEKLKENFTQISIFLFVVFYLLMSMLGNLNIGIRHILPLYPFIFILVSLGISKWLSELPDFEFSQNPEIAKKLFSFYGQKIIRYFTVFLLILWYIISSISSYPNFLTYFNESIGGPSQGYKYVSDSNLDWGQSLKELAVFVKENNIKELQLDYFGGGSPKYYLKDKYTPYKSYMGEPKGWFAVSAQLYTLATGTPDPSYQREERDSYPWLKNKEPVNIIGNSILVFYFK